MVVLTVKQGVSGFALGGVPFICPYHGYPIGRVGVPSGDFMHYGSFDRERLSSGPELSYGDADGVDCFWQCEQPHEKRVELALFCLSKLPCDLDGFT